MTGIAAWASSVHEIITTVHLPSLGAPSTLRFCRLVNIPGFVIQVTPLRPEDDITILQLILRASEGFHQLVAQQD